MHDKGGFSQHEIDQIHGVDKHGEPLGDGTPGPAREAARDALCYTKADVEALIALALAADRQFRPPVSDTSWDCGMDNFPPPGRTRAASRAAPPSEPVPMPYSALREAIARAAPPAAPREPSEGPFDGKLALSELVQFFRDEEVEWGRKGDYNDWSPERAAIELIRHLRAVPSVPPSEPSIENPEALFAKAIRTAEGLTWKLAADRLDEYAHRLNEGDTRDELFKLADNWRSWSVPAPPSEATSPFWMHEPGPDFISCPACQHPESCQSGALRCIMPYMPPISADEEERLIARGMGEARKIYEASHPGTGSGFMNPESPLADPRGAPPSEPWRESNFRIALQNAIDEMERIASWADGDASGQLRHAAIEARYAIKACGAPPSEEPRT